MYLFETFIGDVGVYLSSGDGRMTKHRLDTADIGAIHEEVGSKAVTERVGMDVF